MPPAAPRLRGLGLAALLSASPVLLGDTRAPLPLDGFAAGIQHWAKAHGADYLRLAPDDIDGIAANLLLYQRTNGGWRENDDPLRILSAEERAAVAAARPRTDTSFDNDATCPQITYLAAAFQLTGDDEYRAAARRGLEFVFNAQHASGAWPHSYPETAAYRGRLTFADAVTPNVLRLLHAVAAGAEPFGWTGPALRARARAAAERGDAAVLRLQIRQGGRPTGWAGQYDPDTLAPAQGRSFELPAIVSRETVEVLRYLMSLESPPPELVAAVEAGARWLRESALHGWRLERTATEPIRYRFHTATEDVRLVADPAAPPLWARFYDLETNLPVLADRSGDRVASFDQIEHERRTGYDWYGHWPAVLLETELPAWRARLVSPASP